MELKRILDADMATLAGWLRSGLAWWVDELRAMVPKALRPGGKPLADWALWRGPGQLDITGGNRGGAMPVLVATELCLVRSIALPPLGGADLQRLVRMDADRILPMPAARLVIAAQPDLSMPGQVMVAGLPRTSAEAMLADLAGAGITPARVGLADPAQPGTVALDLTAGMADAGLLPRRRDAAAPWWVLAGFLFLLNGGLLVLRDMQTVARMETLVAQQAPAVRAARAISSRITATQRQALDLARRRQRQDALGVLGAVTATMPERAWVQRYAWAGTTLRLSGYKRQGVDVAGALRKSPWLAEVRAGSTEAVAELPTGQPFDLTAAVREPAR